MKFNLSFAEVKGIAEFMRKYKDGYIAKGFLGNNSISIKIRKSGLDSYYLHFYLPDALFFSRENRIFDGKNIEILEDFKILDVLDPGTDRWIVIKGPRYSISIELMGGGNFVVYDDEKILFKIKELKRKSMINGKFISPEIIDFLGEDFDWVNVISKSTGDPVRTLAAKIGLSKYAEEALCYLGIPINSNRDLIDNLPKLKEFANNIVQESKKMNIYIYGEKYLVIKSHCSDEDITPKPIWEALEEIYDNLSASDSDKYLAIKRDMERLEKEAENLKEIGNLIMIHFSEIQDLLQRARRGEIRQGVDFERRRVKVELDGKEIELDMDKSAGENANSYYDASKKIRSKLEKINVEDFKQKPKKQKKKLSQRIFQNYRWFITSEGNLVLAGKDAESNDSVVKKYLDEKDIYLHADIHGAPSVVLKNINGITEISINEAAQFAWCMSKAWNAGFGNGSVFYVTKSQVSKTPESGEYVPRGAWIIRGKKNYVTHLELKLGIGFQKYQNREYVVSAPTSALKPPYAVIIPGEQTDLVDKVSDFLNVEKELIYPVLPPGKSTLEKFVEGSNPSEEYNEEDGSEEGEDSYNPPEQ